MSKHTFEIDEDITVEEFQKLLDSAKETIVTKEQLIEFEQLTKPLIEYIRYFYTPHTKIIIDWNDAGGWNFDKSLSDLINK